MDGLGKYLFKIDLFETYDSIHLVLLEEMLLGLRFPSKFVKWIMCYVRIVYNFLHSNGEIKDFYMGKKGLRQGDPNSPLLFVICLDYLSWLISYPPPQFVFHKNCVNLNLVHLAFLNDLLLFCADDAYSVLFCGDVCLSLKF